MYKETKRRSLLKGVSWRVIATLTTMIIVYVFFGRLDLAIATGVIETIAKILFYFIHERVWHKIKFGKKKIEPFNLWFTGIPLSGKTTIANLVYKELQKLDIPIERIDSSDIRELIPDIGFSKEERTMHLKRVAHLISTLQNNSVSVVASFVSPYEFQRKIVNEMTNNYWEIYIKTNIETCQKRDYKGVYEKAYKGELKNFTGVSDVYEEPKHPSIIIDTENETPEEAAKKILKLVKNKY